MKQADTGVWRHCALAYMENSAAGGSMWERSAPEDGAWWLKLAWHSVTRLSSFDMDSAVSIDIASAIVIGFAKMDQPKPESVAAAAGYSYWGTPSPLLSLEPSVAAIAGHVTSAERSLIKSGQVVLEGLARAVEEVADLGCRLRVRLRNEVAIDMFGTRLPSSSVAAQPRTHPGSSF